MGQILAGDRIGNRLVIAVYEGGFAFVRCDCGSARTAKVRTLAELRGNGGCAKCAAKHRHANSHGATLTPEYAVWGSMLARTGNPNHKAFKNYGARQIHVHPRYRDGENGEHGFVLFMRDLGPRPTVGRWTIERLNNSRGYEPGNIAWRSWTDQARNRRNNVHVVLAGVTMTKAAAAEKIGISQQTLRHRLKTMTIEQAALMPLGKTSKSHKLGGIQNAA